MSLYQSDRQRPRLGPPLEAPGQLAIIGVVVWLIGALVHPLAALLVPLGIALLLLAGVAYLVRPKRHTMYWRGREIDLADSRGAADQLYHLIFRR
jgi:hypothetical protein